MTTKVTIELTDDEVARIREHAPSPREYKDTPIAVEVTRRVYDALPDPDEELIKDMLRVYYALELMPDMKSGDRNRAGMEAVLDLVRERDGR